MRGDLQGVVGVTAVAAGVAGDQFQRIVVRGQLQRTEAALAVFEGAAQESDDLGFGKRLEHVDAATREQRGDDLEGGILGGCADEADGAALDVGQEGVLLRLVEAVNLIDEEDGPRVHPGGLRGGDHHLLDLLDAAHDGGELDESSLGGLGDDLGQGGLAHAGRTPEDHGAGVVALDLHAERFAEADEVLLSEQFLQTPRAHPLGQGRGAEGAFGAFGFAVEEAHRKPFLWSRGPPLLADRCRETS